MGELNGRCPFVDEETAHLDECSMRNNIGSDLCGVDSSTIFVAHVIRLTR